MKLLTEELRKELPKLYSQEENNDPFVYIKFFFPAGNYTWFVTEGEEEDGDFMFFGYVVGHAEEWGYFTLKQLEEIEVHGLKIERDLYFKQGNFKEVLAQFKKERGA